ncbi:hypothetical protein HMN09_00943200 [Mycena chlorophos]|uniref:Uncharacterized protein n=1 Tax=Mycena chlorophos TaxID=658473 RepID=A0A8H6SLQ1_MYCCL|nr:hypothetical protein HMN09_00943200 [Mycena chlorophos]
MSASIRKDAYYVVLKRNLPPLAPSRADEGKRYLDELTSRLATLPKEPREFLSNRIRLHANNSLAKEMSDLGLQREDELSSFWVLTKMNTIEEATAFWTHKEALQALGDLSAGGLIFYAQPKICLDVSESSPIDFQQRAHMMSVIYSPPGVTNTVFTAYLKKFLDELVGFLQANKYEMLKHTLLQPMEGDSVPDEVYPSYLHPGPEIAVVLIEYPSMAALAKDLERPESKVLVENFFKLLPGIRATGFCVDIETNFRVDGA